MLNSLLAITYNSEKSGKFGIDKILFRKNREQVVGLAQTRKDLLGGYLIK